MSYPLAIYYATMTGNAESLARRAYERALNEGWSAQLINLSEVKPADLADVGLALFIVSTWGDGEPPADATDFYYDLEKTSALALSRLRHAVLGLGDRDYTEFNAFARNLDERLAALGARRLHARVEADLDYEDTYAEWETRVFPLLAGLRSAVQANHASP
ncbi:MAG TPA: flavodoxin domain-containing protein [Opitutaceae bacterium]